MKTTIVSSAEKQYIFEEDRPFPSCHASTLVVLPDGGVLAAWFGGLYEKASDVAIWMSRRVGSEWSAPYKIADEEGIAHWNPVLSGEGNKLELYYKVGHEIPDWFTRIIRSTDGGVTWSEPAELVQGDIGGRGPVRNKPIRLNDGTILAPASIERWNPDEPGKQLWEAVVDISKDEGHSWTLSSLVPMEISKLIGTRFGHAKGFIQPTLWSTDGMSDIHMLLRSTEGYIYRSDSNDGGRTWNTAYPTELPNNNSGIDLVRMESGMLALVFNPVSASPVSGSLRTPLVIRFSADNGLTWTDEFTLEDEPGEYSYPAIVARGRELFVTYTWKRERIVFWKLSL